MFGWFRERKRKKLAAQPFPGEWEKILRANVAHYCMLNGDERFGLNNLIKVFLAEKNWEGCGGLKLTDEIKVTIAGQACLLILNLPHEYYRDVESILIYPSTVVPPSREPGFFEIPKDTLGARHPLLGQAFKGGPVILAWDAVKANAKNPHAGANVVYHEFAHKLDMLDGAADGTPPLKSREEYREWVRVCS